MRHGQRLICVAVGVALARKRVFAGLAFSGRTDTVPK